MIANQNEQRNFQAVSAVDVDGKIVAVVNLSANYNSSNRVLQYAQAIQNMDLYKANAQTVNEDIETFKGTVESAIIK